MSNYETVRSEFFDLQRQEKLISKRFTCRELIMNGRALKKPAGFAGVEIYCRPDGSRICEEECFGGAAHGCARYYSSTGDLVGQDYYQNGGVTSFQVFS